MIGVPRKAFGIDRRDAGAHRRRSAGLWVILVLCGMIGLAFGGHWSIRRFCQFQPPEVTIPGGSPEDSGQLRRFENSYVRFRGGIMQVGLSGTPETLGYSHAKLLYPEMLEIEQTLLTRFTGQVPSYWARHLLLDLAELRYRNLDLGMSRERRAELSAQAQGFQPDPFTRLFPTYQRFLYLNALYDIALSFEDSPLVGCTSFVFSGSMTEHGAGILARAFDFEYDEVFDRKKAVFLVREAGQIPFASVAWPGLIGVVSGMNAEGLSVVVHGARAGEPQTQGEPLAHALRRVLSVARSSSEAVARLAEQPVLVSHIVILTDSQGDSRVLERIPGRPQHVRWLPDKAVITNHLEGPARDDPKNQRVLQRTSTVPRRDRGEELLAELKEPVSMERSAGLLRDRRGSRGRDLPLGDRAAIDALIATHGVVMDTAKRMLWVSEAPHLLGRFVGFDLGHLLSPNYDPAETTELFELAADPLLESGQYQDFRSRLGARP